MVAVMDHGTLERDTALGRPVELDASQTEVLGRPAGASFSVIGAPGSGKTTVLAELAAHRVLGQGLPLDRLLVLTPTRRGATALRDRLALRLGLPSSGPLARTPVSAAFALLRGSAREREVALLTGAEQDSIVADLLQGELDDEAAGGAGLGWPESLPPEVRRLRAFRTELRELMMRATESGVGARRLDALGRRHGVPEWCAAARFLAAYQGVVDSYDAERLDSAELLAEARAVLRRRRESGGAEGSAPALVLVDDAHDLPVGAWNLLSEFARSGSAVVAFGDPDVATTGFRGSDVRALGQLGRALGVAVLPPLVLQTSHRQSGALRALTRRITERTGAAAAGTQRTAGSQRTESPATAGDAPGARPAGRVLTIQADTRAGEIATVARVLREQHLLHGVDWHQMAVIVRSGSLVPGLARGLALAEVPTRTHSAVQALREDYAARHLIGALALAIGASEPTPDAVDDLLLGPLGGIDGIGLRRLRLALRHDELAQGGSRHADELLREALATPGALATFDSAPARRVAALATTLAAVADRARAGESVESLLWELWQRSGLARRWGDLASGSGVLAEEADRNLDGAVALFTAARRSVERDPSRAPELFVAEVLGAEVPEDTLSPHSRADSVLVTTPTGAVGLEVEVVVVAGLQESVWPNLRLRNSLLHAERMVEVADHELADNEMGVGPHPVTAAVTLADSRAEVLSGELRMLALSTSRARSLAVLSCVANDEEQPSAFFGFAPDADPVPTARQPLTLRGLTGQLRRRLVERGDRQAAPALARLAAEGVPGAAVTDWYGLAPASTEHPLVDPADPEAVVRVSPSRIEAFEQSPLVWFVDQVAGGSKSLAAGIGTIVHAVMEGASTDPDADLSPEALAESAGERWTELRFEAPWLEQREQRALRVKLEGLSDYLREFRAGERELAGAEATFALRQGRALVSGSIDRVERLPDGRLVVIDLKTGRTPPRRADLPGHAQLASYQLALHVASIDDLPLDDAGPLDDPGAPAVDLGGAALLYVSKGGRGSRFTVLDQEPLDEEALALIRSRIDAVADGMSGARFRAVAEPEERDHQNRYEYRIQLVKAVSE
ncbi:PD-(D/E)XK nuclease family protein [Herbiconiux moechotypicola]|uniref:UrvD/REP family ATP-dependent DNA helicase n=1 Tax=Herbiconiux moechotypicola TaxID=637393 RepID=UPI00217EE5F2|nr:UrvD/REP family ATP-dependent DNA helicase [Herbiconiux moechotypicola]MCS5730328.1 PD-(D/E)XK nuclease family protein [Herbiconiux moechotypicola]